MIKTVSGFGMVIAFVAVIGLVMSFPVMLLWNYCLVPALTIAVNISWLQAWGIMVLTGILFKTSAEFKK